MSKRNTLSSRLRFSVLHRDNFTCVYCGRKPPEVRLCIDHKTPVSRGGGDSPSNLATACYTCNAGKSDAFSTGTEEEEYSEISGVLYAAGSGVAEVISIIDYRQKQIWIRTKNIACQNLSETKETCNRRAMFFEGEEFLDSNWLRHWVPDIFETGFWPKNFYEIHFDEYFGGANDEIDIARNQLSFVFQMAPNQPSLAEMMELF